MRRQSFLEIILEKEKRKLFLMYLIGGYNVNLESFTKGI